MSCCPQGTPPPPGQQELVSPESSMHGAWLAVLFLPVLLREKGGSERGWGLPRVTQLLNSRAQVRQAGTWDPLLQGLHLAKHLEQQNAKKL